MFMWSTKVVGVSLVCVLSSLLTIAGARSGAQSKPTSEWTRWVVPAAQCGPGARPESGLQGQMTSAERFSAKASRAYRCNLELVGQFEGEGGYNSMATLDTCGYFSTVGVAEQRHRGVVVVDASDRRRPQATAYLDSPAMVRPNESLDAHPGRKLLGAVMYTEQRVSSDSSFDLYESVDCQRPILKSSLPLPETFGHAGRFAPDGRTYYATSWDARPSNAEGLVAIDVSEPGRPKVILRWRGLNEQAHDIAIGADGTR